MPKAEHMTELNELQMRIYNGGAPNKDSGFWYDVTYLIVLGTMMPDHTNFPGYVA